MAKDPKDTVTELIELVKSYARQETVNPLRNLGRYLARGVAGALLMAIGLFFLTMAALRYVQTHRFFGQHLTGGWSWAPYGMLSLIVAIIAGAYAMRISKKDDHG